MELNIYTSLAELLMKAAQFQPLIMYSDEKECVIFTSALLNHFRTRGQILVAH